MKYELRQQAISMKVNQRQVKALKRNIWWWPPESGGLMQVAAQKAHEMAKNCLQTKTTSHVETSVKFPVIH